MRQLGCICLVRPINPLFICMSKIRVPVLVDVSVQEQGQSRYLA